MLLEREQKPKENNTRTNDFVKVIFFFCDGDAEKGPPFTAAYVLFTTVTMTSPLSSYAARFKVVAFSLGYIEGDVIRYTSLEVNNCYFREPLGKAYFADRWSVTY